MLCGKYIVLPWLGYAVFSWLTIVGKNLHNFVGPALHLRARGGIPAVREGQLPPRCGTGTGSRGSADVLRGGGAVRASFNGRREDRVLGRPRDLRHRHGVTGLILDFPNWDQLRESMQLANVVHASPPCSSSARAWATSTWARSACRARTTRCGRLCRRGVGEGAPRAVVRGGQGGQTPGEDRGHRPQPAPGDDYDASSAAAAGFAGLVRVARRMGEDTPPPPAPPWTRRPRPPLTKKKDAAAAKAKAIRPPPRKRR